MRQRVTAGEIEGFFDEYATRCRHRGPLEGHLRYVRHSVNRFVEYLRQEGRFVAPAATQAIYQPLLDAYLQWMRCYQHAAPATLALRAGSLAQFLRWLGPDAVPRRWARLDCEKVEQFVLSYASGKGRGARGAMPSALRTFFRFALRKGYLRQPLDRAVPLLRTYQWATAPRGLTAQQAQDVLQLSKIVRRRLQAAGIDLPGAAAHVFRHAFATRMLHKGHGLKAIADMLGHRRLSSTFIYTKVDFNALQQVALEWPREVSP